MKNLITTHIHFQFEISKVLYLIHGFSIKIIHKTMHGYLFFLIGKELFN